MLGGGSTNAVDPPKLTFLRCNCAGSFYLESLEGRIEHPASEMNFNHSSFRERSLERGRVRGIMQLCSSQPRLLCVIGRGRTAVYCDSPLFAMNLTNRIHYLTILTAIQTPNHNSTCFVLIWHRPKDASQSVQSVVISN